MEPGSEWFFCRSVMPQRVELAGSLSLPSFLTLPFLYIYTLFFSLALFSLLSCFLSSFSSFFYLLFFFGKSRLITSLGTDGSYCEMITNLPHTWTFVSYDTKSSVRCWCLLQSVLHRRCTKVLVQSPCFRPSYVPCSS